MNALNQIEVGWLHGLHDAVGCAFLDFVMPLITSLSDAGIFWIILAVILLFFRKTRRAGMTMGLALIFGLLLCNLTLKPLTAR
ncbi:MAG: phosphatase PAP2 family protein, partial [Clostridia bacterium]|nr:phosphatase PAP2 family protein [Clostridia bacterium]